MIQMWPAPFDGFHGTNRMWDPSGDQLGQRATIPDDSWVSWASPVPSGLTVYIWLVAMSVKAIRPSAWRLVDIIAAVRALAATVLAGCRPQSLRKVKGTPVRTGCRPEPSAFIT